MWGSSRHAANEDDTTTEYRLCRNGSPITAGFTENCDGTPGDESAGHDTDNSLMPVWFQWMDAPGGGTFTYTIESRGTTGTTFTNVRDDGSDGFEGSLVALEFKIATEGLE